MLPPAPSPLVTLSVLPPLAVTGFGIATGHFEIAGGAFFLFMTNLLAIALSVTVLARFYGFGERHSPRHARWQNALIISVFVALSIPLGLSLRDSLAAARQVLGSCPAHVVGATPYATDLTINGLLDTLALAQPDKLVVLGAAAVVVVPVLLVQRVRAA